LRHNAFHSTGHDYHQIVVDRETLHSKVARKYVAYTPGPSPNVNVERKLRRWLAVNPRADAAAGFCAGWSRLARFLTPKLRDWEARWFRAMRENDRLKARVGSLLREVSRINERG
jgi:hypothetical protein